MKVFEYHDLPFCPDPGDIVYIDKRIETTNGNIVSLHHKAIDLVMQSEYGKRFWYLPTALDDIPDEMRR